MKIKIAGQISHEEQVPNIWVKIIGCKLCPKQMIIQFEGTS
jgi:hypothetical protein